MFDFRFLLARAAVPVSGSGRQGERWSVCFDFPLGWGTGEAEKRHGEVRLGSAGENRNPRVSVVRGTLEE